MADLTPAQLERFWSKVRRKLHGVSKSYVYQVWRGALRAA